MKIIPENPGYLVEKMTVYIAIDDTDMPDTPGTGKLAREIVEKIKERYNIEGITRHQFFVHPDIPYTSHNSGAVIHLSDVPESDLSSLFEEIKHLVRARYAEGSDPGVCVARHYQVTPSVMVYGRDAKQTVLTRNQAINLAKNAGILLEGLAGTEDGIIGALAGVGLAASGCDGRYLQLGTIRNLSGQATVQEIKNAGIPLIQSVDGREITEGMVHFRKFPQPIRMGGRPVLLVNEEEGRWVVQRRD